MFGALDISASALVAQRTRMEVLSSNIANQDAVFDAEGKPNPFRRRIPVFAPGDPATGNALGVHIQEIRLDEAPFRLKYQPGHPAAREDGYVRYPNIDSVMESVNALEAARAYEANITVAENTKQMLQRSLQLLA